MSEQGAMRVSDGDRAQVADRLARAHGEGRLTLAEYDERVRAAHGAVVRDDLASLLTDLPADAPERAGTTSGRGPGRGASPVRPGGLRGPVAAWATISAVNVLVWLAVVLGSGAMVYPWWVWVAGPWGLALALGAVTRGRGMPCAGARLPS